MPDFTDPPTPPTATPTPATPSRSVLIWTIGLVVLVIAVGSFLADRTKTPVSAAPTPGASSSPTDAPPGVWTQLLGGNNSDSLSAVAVAPSGTIVTIGTAPTAMLLGFSPEGEIVFSKPPNTIAGGISVLAVAPDGSIVVAGSAYTDGGMDAYLNAYSPTGDPTWSKTLGGPSDDAFTGVTVAQDGTITAVGYTCSTSGDFPPAPAIAPPDPCGVALAAAFDPAGDMLWAKTYGGDAHSAFWGVAAAPDGSVAVIGQNSATDGDLPAPQAMAGTVPSVSLVGKLASDGTLDWAQELGDMTGDSANPTSVAVDQTGAILAAGSSAAADGHFATAHPGVSDAVVAKFTADGSFAWCRAVGGSTSMSQFTHVAVMSDGSAVAAGVTFATDGDAPIHADSAAQAADGLLARIGPDGALTWARAYGGTQTDWLNSVAIAGGDYIAVVGYSRSNDGDFAPTPSNLTGTESYAVLSMIAPDGTQAPPAPDSSASCSTNAPLPASSAPSLVGPNGTWTRTLSDPAELNRFIATAVAPDGTIYALNDITALLYAFAPDGTQLRQSWPDSLSCAHPTSLAFTASGNVVVAGSSKVSTSMDAFIAELSPTGEELWSKTLGGSSDDGFTGAVVAPDGTILAVGYTSSTNGTLPPAPEAAAAQIGVAVAVSFTPDGTQRWAKTYGGNDSSRFYGVAATPDGSFAVIGLNGAPDGDLPPARDGGGGVNFLAKLGTDGTIAWADDLDSARVDPSAVAADSSGSIFVAGRGILSAAVARFTGAGTLTWSMSVDELSNGYFGSQFVSVAVAPDGSVVAAGRTPVNDPSDLTAEPYPDGLVARFAADGTSGWQRAYGGSRYDWFTTVALTSDNHIVVGGDGTVNDGYFAPASASPSPTSSADGPSYTVLAMLAPDGTPAPR